MVGYKIAKFLLLTMAVDLLLFTSTEVKAWWGRRRYRCSPHAPPKGVAWKNHWHQSLSFECKTSKSIRLWQSEHSNCAEDRIHYFECGYGPGRYSERNCRWTSHYVNDYDGPVTFKCGHNGFITGVKSHYNTGARDRRFQFRCCHKSRYSIRHCKHTATVNHWDGYLSYRVPSGYFLTGAYSHHVNRYEDRRWKFEICQFKQSR
ncbi:unnamed protein product [Porites evermanni]|uniref:Dermatopontin n=1 Tax=Porites evermanni TaxID=104178 RepID=A0ABN8Q8M3_9CNID|nr:unnamed protein product [Porites evermanni]